MVLNRSSLRLAANDLRLAHGPAYVIESLYTEAAVKGGDAVIESVRAIGEAEFLKQKGSPLIAVDAERPIRYARIVGRASATDKLDFETWVAEEEREWHNTAAYDMNVPAVMALADYTIRNDGTLPELRTRVDAILTQLPV
jgi:dephospho-CoA kinase